MRLFSEKKIYSNIIKTLKSKDHEKKRNQKTKQWNKTREQQ